MVYKIIENFETFHDTSVACIEDNKLKCILETERVTKHKHANYEHPQEELIPYIVSQYKIKDYELIQFSDAITYKSHHELHAIGSFYSSGFEKSAILVIDGEGNQEDGVTLFYANGKKLVELKKYNKNASLGALYNIGAWLIYREEHAEGKMMGLSCCAEPEYSIPSPIQYHEDGTVELLYNTNNENSLMGILEYIRDKLSYLFNVDGTLINADVYKAKLAATVQWWFTEQVVNLVKYLKSLTPRVDNLCLGGGCFLNCETNGVIDRLGLFKNVYCIPAPADNGLILGKVQQILPEPIKINSPYLGINYTKSFDDLKLMFRIENENSLDSNISNFQNVCEYSEDWVIERLKQNKVIVWFDGASEFGPRALGHRSFLANPMTNEMFWKLSVGIKQRETHRPLAPITTDNLYSLVFDDPNPENLTQFMLKTVKIKEEWFDKLKAVVHVNQTARPQRLTKDINPELHSLIENFYKQTGIPCLINTSLNLKGQPLLETYSDLINVLNNKLLSGNKVSAIIDHKLCFDIE